jgi:hypothetical protein
MKIKQITIDPDPYKPHRLAQGYCVGDLLFISGQAAIDENGQLERSLRYLEWVYDPDENDTTCVSEFVYLLRKDIQPAWVEHEQHLYGLFSRAEWLQLLSAVGFHTEIVRDQYGRDIFVARKPKG